MLKPRFGPARPSMLVGGCVVGAVVVLGWLLQANQSVKVEARQQFFAQYNRQQQLLAEQAARSIEGLFATYRRNLSLVASLFEGEPVTRRRAVAVSRSLRKVSQVLRDTPIIDLVVFDEKGDVVAIDPADPYTLGRNYAWRGYFKWARDRGRPGQLYLSPFMRLEGGQERGAKALIVAQGIYGPRGEFRGVAMCTLNFDELARRHILSIRIGEQGYAWLVDSQNRTVLVDPRGRVGGQDFDEAFRDRWPVLHQLLLSTRDGRPGVGWYDFEDPADPKQTVRKLVGYVPVRIEQRLWTLGVCTPENQVEALMGSFLRRQEAFSWTAVAALLAVTAALSTLLLTWNRSLAHEVDTRTLELERARARVETAFEELLAARRVAAVGNLALGMVHEIRNPLSSIRMNMQMIRKKVRPEGVLVESFSIVEEEILRLNRLLTEVMTFARPGPLKLSEVPLAAVVDRVISVLDSRTRAAGIRVGVSTGPCLPPALCDPDQIQQVVLNLALNAVEALEEIDGDRSLDFTLAHRDGGLELRITDSAGGISPGDREHIFDPFFTTKAEGGGLGLALSENIVLRHGGSLAVESAPGRGTTFVLHLPDSGPTPSPSVDSPPLPRHGVAGAPPNPKVTR